MAATLAAQGRTWIVDRNNGAGTDFLDIPPAVAAASDGDTLRIRPGVYSPFSTGKALALLGEAGVIVRGGFAPRLGVVEIRQLPAGRSLVMDRIRVEPLFDSAGVVGSSCQGRIHLEDVEVVAPTITTTDVGACSFVQCTLATITGGALYGSPALRAATSVVVATGVRIDGADNCGAMRCTIVGTGIRADNATVLLARSSVSGGDGSFFNPFITPEPAIRALGSTLVATGDATTTICAGSVPNGPPIPGIQADIGAVHLDTSIAVLGSNGGPDIAGTATVQRRRIPALLAAGTPPGGTLGGELTALAGSPFQIIVSLPGDPIALPFGTVLFDPTIVLPIAIGTIGASGRFPFAVQMPANPALADLPVVLQAATADPVTVFIELSNGVVVTLN
jgi:hypothetical protein